VDVLFVVPPAPNVYAKEAVNTPEYSSPPLGICYIVAALGVFFRDMNDVVVSTTGCLNLCEHGPVMVVYPENHWYGSVNEEATETADFWMADTNWSVLGKIVMTNSTADYLDSPVPSPRRFYRARLLQ